MTAIPLPITEERKAAYRHLLYVAMLDIRGRCQSRGKPSRSPWVWYRSYFSSRTAGAIADWLHNLAKTSSNDFAEFSEDWFWKQHADYCAWFPQEGLERYREIFDEYLAGRTWACC